MSTGGRNTMIPGRLPTVERGPNVELRIDGTTVTAFEGETIAAVLLVSGPQAFRRTEISGEPRSFYCGMGICFECLVTVNGEPNVRSCMTAVRNGMSIETRGS